MGLQLQVKSDESNFTNLIPPRKSYSEPFASSHLDAVFSADCAVGEVVLLAAAAVAPLPPVDDRHHSTLLNKNPQFYSFQWLQNE